MQTVRGRGLELVAYQVTETPLEIVTGVQRREWMDNLPERFAYRCLPLLIANQAGWDLLCPGTFSVRWNGRPAKDAVKFKWEGEPASSVSSHFGSGVITFSPGYLFRTPKDHNIWARGCPNYFKDGVIPLDGIIETDWAPFTFTMNWKITRPKTWIRFEKGEPVCRILPFPRHYLEQVHPRKRHLIDNRKLARQTTEWSNSRRDFLENLRARDEDTIKEGWQRDYMRGTNTTGTRMTDHQTKLDLRDFLDFTK